MSEPQNVCKNEEVTYALDITMCESDKRFFQNLYEFIDQEKKYLQCPAEGPDELRYFIYRSVFNKVIGQMTAYKRLLINIKTEYENTIRELRRKEDEAAASQQTAVTSTSHQRLLMTCQRQAAQLRHIVSVLQSQMAELQEELRRRNFVNQRLWLPGTSCLKGLTVADSEDLEVLHDHLKDFEFHRTVLLDRKSRRVPLEVQVKLKAELQAAEHHRDRLSSENNQLMLLNKHLRFVHDRLSCWDEAGQKVPLEEALGSAIRNIQHLGLESETDDDYSSIHAELFEDDQPTGIDEAKLLEDHLDRFVELFKSARYEEATLHAARSPRGVLKNSDTMEMFRGVDGPPGSTPPALLYFQALLVTVATGDRLPAEVSLQGISCLLKHGDMRLVTHAVTQNKLMFSEDLGDILTEHAQKKPIVADLSLALATVVYESCRIYRKSALSMCRRGFVHSAAEFMKRNLTADECMWVVCCSGSLSLLQLLTDTKQSQAAMLSVGAACSSLLADPQQHQLAVQLLDGFMNQGEDMLENIILEDSGSSVDDWDRVASLCSELNRDNLSQAVRSVLWNQIRTGVQSPDLEGESLMEHVFL
ncbi:clathrin heavy chain linker domain-containing protein 1 isoform X2 [Kryptolebias marmoratus]|uniref:clathrin heavy chain linker domain-containing protein 1 isoform X2 n=1 Tax=Kryptolebias marmoratus TaxID=37003 RepID=UPI000D52FA42|nr:clathrin heavy chain linker domain-containing protein 1 isoform X2 [Kryptolebias marmoratus]